MPRFGPGPPAGLPSSRTSPDVGISSPAAMRSSVVLPQPDGPTIAINSPLCTSTLTPFKADEKKADIGFLDLAAIVAEIVNTRDVDRGRADTCEVWDC